MAKLTLKESVQNLEWVAKNIRELREIFTPDNQAPTTVGDILVFSAALGALGIEPKEFGRVFLIFFTEILEPLRDAGVITIKQVGIGAMVVSRKNPDGFEIAATQQQVDAVLDSEPTEETRELADQYLNKLFGQEKR